MKKIGIISDTHGTFDGTLREFLKDVDEIWHAGDIGSLELADAIAAFKPLRAVSGNIDGGLTRRVYPDFLSFECEGVRVLMTHIGGYPRRYDPRAVAKIQSCARNSSLPDTRTSSKSPTTRFTPCCTSIPAPPESTGSTKSAPPCGWSSTAPTCATWRSANGRGDSRNRNKICGVMTPHILLLLDKSAA